MGSLFSKNTRPRPEPEADAPPPPPDEAEPPAKRRRLGPRSEAAEPPATRAMLEAAAGGQPSSPQPPAEAEAEAEPDAEPDADGADADGTRPARRPKRKYALFLGYVGEGYSGMQINPGVVTVEQVLLSALFRADLISASNATALSRVRWMRSARTDKGVSAAANCGSVKLLIPNCSLAEATATLNRHLPPDVQAFGLLRATNGFNARGDCHRRRYEYIFPLPLLGPERGCDAQGRDKRVLALSEILAQYKGSHNFANFTEGLALDDDSARRVMIRVQCGDPFLPPGSGVPFVAVEILGQSFLLHQIRKMIAMAMAVYHGHTPKEAIAVAMCGQVKVGTPMAPALGLLLDTLYFEQYNKNHSKKLGGAITDSHFEEEKARFKADRIYHRIAERERLDRTLEEWVRHLGTRFPHTSAEITQLHEKFILTNVGATELRKARIASYYPIRTSMEDFLECEQKEVQQLAIRVRDEFENIYGERATFMARAPGRVVLIGEHLDYNGLPVLGVALTQGTIIAGCQDETKHIDIRHLENEKYAPGRLQAENGAILCSGAAEMESQNGNAEGNGTDASGAPSNAEPASANGTQIVKKRARSQTEEEPIFQNGGEGNTRDVLDELFFSSSSPTAPDTRWLDYMASGTRALIKTLEGKRAVAGGGRLLVGGDLPRAGGLASSSSLVCAATLAAARMNRRRFPRTDLAIRAADAERGGAGTRGGSVDHLVSMCAARGSAAIVGFVPKVSVGQVSLPDCVRLFVVDSGIKAEKGGDNTLRTAFNLRAAECRIAAHLLARRLNVHMSKTVTTPGQLLFQAVKTAELPIANSAELQALAAEKMGLDETLTARQAQTELGVSDNEFQKRFLGGADVGVDENGGEFAVGRRIAHVLGEATRVERMQSALGADALGDEERVQRVGDILNEGQESLRALYDTSCDAVQETVALCRRAGAAGARMTGAGWGGWAVCAVAEHRGEQFFQNMGAVLGERRVIAVRAGAGACVYAIYSSYTAPGGTAKKEAAGNWGGPAKEEGKEEAKREEKEEAKVEAKEEAKEEVRVEAKVEVKEEVKAEAKEELEDTTVVKQEEEDDVDAGSTGEVHAERSDEQTEPTEVTERPGDSRRSGEQRGGGCVLKADRGPSATERAAA